MCIISGETTLLTNLSSQTQLQSTRGALHADKALLNSVEGYEIWQIIDVIVKINLTTVHCSITTANCWKLLPNLRQLATPHWTGHGRHAIKLATSYTFHSQASSEEGLCQLSLLSQRHTQPQHSSADQALGDWPQICTSHYHPCPVIRTRPGTGTWNHKGRNLRNITPMVCIL